MAQKWNFTATGTSKEDVKTQLRGDGNRDCPDSVRQSVLTLIDALQLPAGHTMRVELSGEIDGQTRTELDVHVEMSAS